MTASLHPADHELLRKRLTGQALPWPEGKLALQADASVARGGCRIETPEGRMLVSDISTRLSEIRRHWMEELDDAQIERRRAHDQGQPLRRFPDRREAP
jgi:flagellar biosynthesis/type III secretory pathway protein FliH